MINNHDEFIHFLIEAKNHTYAGDGAHVEPSRPLSHDLRYEKGPYLYIDTYLGGFHFIGEEAVWVDGLPVWGMNYYGWMVVDQIPDGFGECLKAALRQAPVEAPYRGPAVFRQGDFEYRCQWEGKLEQYRGQEQILFKGQEIYCLNFHGGQVKA